MPRRFRLTPPEPRELAIHASCVDALEKLLLPPACFATYPAGIVELSAQQAARYARLGLKRGWPDIMVAYRTLWGHRDQEDGRSAFENTRRAYPARQPTPADRPGRNVPQADRIRRFYRDCHRA